MEQAIKVQYPKVETNGVVDFPAVELDFLYWLTRNEGISRAVFNAIDISEGVVVQKILNRIWRDFNIVDGTEPVVSMKTRSSMVGDLYTILPSELFSKARYFIVDSVGFVEITKNGADIWLNTPWTQRGFVNINRAVLEGEIVNAPLIET
jgi:hypothetical protein